VIGLDLSRRMLREGIGATAQFADRLTLIWQDAEDLPFRDDTFDAVACLEALEFMPHLCRYCRNGARAASGRHPIDHEPALDARRGCYPDARSPEELERRSRRSLSKAFASGRGR